MKADDLALPRESPPVVDFSGRHSRINTLVRFYPSHQVSVDRGATWVDVPIGHVLSVTDYALLLMASRNSRPVERSSYPEAGTQIEAKTSCP